MFSCLFHRSRGVVVLVMAVSWALSMGLAMAQAPDEAPDEVKERLLKALLTDRSAKVRAQAAFSLAEFTDDKRVLDALIQTMSDKSPIVRGTIARVLGLSRAKEAFGTLCQAFFDKDRFVSKWASEGLLDVLKGQREFRVVVGAEIAYIRDATAMEQEEMRRAMMDGLLSVLTKDSKINIQTKLIDFSEGAGSRTSEPDIVLYVSALLEDAKKENGEAIVRVRVRIASNQNCKVWEGVAEGRAVARATDEDEFRDEYSMQRVEVDPRIEAGESAARQAVLGFIRAIREENTDTLTKGGQYGR
jgi:hypothetical protein